MTDFQTASLHVARKPRRCETCRAKIEPGSVYVRTAGVSDGDFYTGSQHEDCALLWNALFVEFGDPFDGMVWDLPEMFLDRGDIREARDELGRHRAAFPGAVARVEARLADWLAKE